MSVEGKHSSSEWGLPEFWEDFLEEAVPRVRKGLDLGQRLQEGGFCG